MCVNANNILPQWVEDSVLPNLAQVFIHLAQKQNILFFPHFTRVIFHVDQLCVIFTEIVGIFWCLNSFLHLQFFPVRFSLLILCFWKGWFSLLMDKCAFQLNMKYLGGENSCWYFHNNLESQWVVATKQMSHIVHLNHVEVEFTFNQFCSFTQRVLLHE